MTTILSPYPIQLISPNFIYSTGINKKFDIISVNGASDRLLPFHAHSINKVATPNPVFNIVVEGVNLTLLHYKGLFLIVIEKVNDNDLKLLKDNSKFRKTD